MEHQENNDSNVVIRLIRGVPAAPIITCIGCYNIHPGKKLKLASCRGTCRPNLVASGRQHDSVLNSPIMTGTNSDRNVKNMENAQGWCSEPREGRGMFPTVIKIYNHAPPTPTPPLARYVSIMRRQKTQHMHFISTLLTAWETTVCLCLGMFSTGAFSLTENYCTHGFDVKPQHKHFVFTHNNVLEVPN